VLLACAWFGLVGGLITAACCSIAYFPHIVLHWSHSEAYQTSQIAELAMFGLIAMVAGLLSDRERLLRRRAEETAAERDRALRDLEETVETLRRADRLATLGTLAAGMAHEIRNPLGAIGGAVEILDDDVPPGHPHREFLDILRRELARLSVISGRYLDYARPHAPDLVAVDLNACVESAVDLVARTAGRSSVRVDRRLGQSLPKALADPVQIHQAVVNLLLNGIQAMDRGGVLEVATAVEGSAVAVTVRDHGPGLPPQSVDRIFEPFFSTKPEGTGLGLAIARHIATAHGGSLGAEDAAGGGARFRLLLPGAPAGTYNDARGSSRLDPPG
jgi:signal transduction histidine kinase